MSIRGPKFRYVVIFFALIALAAGIYDLGFSKKGYEKNTAVIVQINEETSAGDTEHVLIVEHTVGGKTYRGELDQRGNGKEKVGDTVEVLYDPSDPSVIKAAGLGFGIYMLSAGVLLLVFAVGTAIKEKKAQRELEESYPETHYAPSVSGEERTLWFVTDLGTPKYGHRIEDSEGNILYEAKVTKFTLSAPTGFEFIDHEHGKKAPHLIGHEESTEWSTLLIDNHYTFTFDGEFIWDHLKKNGISVESSFADGSILWIQYRIFRDGKEIALVKSCGANARKGSDSDIMPAFGHYVIETAETNLDLLFVTVMAFARTNAHDAQGGNYGLLFGKKSK